MDCNCEDESDIDIVNPMVIDSSHWINVVLTSINIRGCRTSRVCKKGDCDECTMIASYIVIFVVILI